MNKLLYILALLFITVCSAKAQNISVEVPNNIVAGESFRVLYDIAMKEVEEFMLSPLPDSIEEVMEPFPTTMDNNGKKITRYTVVLSAENEGEYVLPAPKVVAGGKEITGHECKIVVRSASEAMAAEADYSSPASGTPSANAGANAEEIFIKALSSKKRLKLNEPVQISYVVYTKGNIETLNASMPELNEFYSVEMPTPEELETTTETVNGIEYSRIVWSRYVMYPQKTGTISVPGITFVGAIRVKTDTGDVFDAILNPEEMFVTKECEVQAPVISFIVDALPTPPQGFSGGVGKFSMSIDRMAEDTVAVDEPIKIAISIKGNGNIKLLKAPVVAFPKSFTVQDMTTTDSITFTQNAVTGEVIYEYTAIPNAPGDYEIPPIMFTYYDTDSCKYVTRTYNLPHIKVMAGKNRRSMIAPIIPYKDISLGSNHDLLFSKTHWMTLLLQILLFVISYWLIGLSARRRTAQAMRRDAEKKAADEMAEQNTVDEIRRRFEQQGKATILILALLMSAHLHAAPSDIELANKAYAESNYQKAAELYEKSLRKQPSADIQYNLGNAYFELKEMGKCILNYERASLIKPFDSSLENNMAIAKRKVQDKLAEPADAFLLTWWRQLVYLVSVNCWVIMSLVFFALLLMSILAYRFCISESHTKRAFYSGLASLVLCLFSLVFAISQRYMITHSAKAVVMQVKAEVLTAPEHNAKKLVTIHEGETVEIIDDGMKEWKEVKLPDDRTGWINGNDIEQVVIDCIAKDQNN